jgi:hypothetical protein
MANNTVALGALPPLPTNICDAIALYHEHAPFIVAAVNGMIATDPNAERVAILKLRVRTLLDTAGYIAQAQYNLPDEYFGAGGSGKPPLVATDTSVDCPGLPHGS